MKWTWQRECLPSHVLVSTVLWVAGVVVTDQVDVQAGGLCLLDHDQELLEHDRPAAVRPLGRSYIRTPGVGSSGSAAGASSACSDVLPTPGAAATDSADASA